MGTPSEKQIRSGTYGTIFKFTDNLGKLYAKKVIPKLRKIPSDEFLDNTINIAREIALWQCLSGIPNVVPLLGHKELEDSQVSFVDTSLAKFFLFKNRFSDSGTHYAILQWRRLNGFNEQKRHFD